MAHVLPDIFLQRLKDILPPDILAPALASFSDPAPVTVRINTLKTSCDQMRARLTELGAAFRVQPWSEEALMLEGVDPQAVGTWAEVEDGRLYRQQTASMLPVLALAPQPGERVLDMCAAPGSKTTQMAALMRNEGEIVALEAVRSRFYRLRSVVELLDARNVTLKWIDARRYRDAALFDKILVDAPCSSEGRFRTDDPKTCRYWSPRKIKEMAHKQRGLLQHAGRLLRPGGCMVYATCTFAPEENEAAIDWFLRKTDGAFEVEEVSFEGVRRCPALTLWQGRAYHPQTARTFRVCPGNGMEGFFLARLIKQM